MGDQGVGKSTILSLLGEFKYKQDIIDVKSHMGSIDSFYLDFEKGTPRANPMWMKL
jgi:pantothenate kinase-related protein Tda10